MPANDGSSVEYQRLFLDPEIEVQGFVVVKIYFRAVGLGTFRGQVE